MWFNPILSFILRSPLYPMLGDTMLVTVIGRKTGKKYTMPVGFYHEDDVMWIITNRDRTWWRNVRGGANVSMHVYGKDETGFAEAVLDESSVRTQVADYLRHIPMAARSLKVHIENGKVDPVDATRLAKEKLFVKIRITEVN
ncbi:MAG TPA: nitroreductase/quinone reductase family protein [Anaerolineales bacterium]